MGNFAMKRCNVRRGLGAMHGEFYFGFNDAPGLEGRLHIYPILPVTGYNTPHDIVWPVPGTKLTDSR